MKSKLILCTFLIFITNNALCMEKALLPKSEQQKNTFRPYKEFEGFYAALDRNTTKETRIRSLIQQIESLDKTMDARYKNFENLNASQIMQLETDNKTIIQNLGLLLSEISNNNNDHKKEFLRLAKKAQLSMVEHEFKYPELFTCPTARTVQITPDIIKPGMMLLLSVRPESLELPLKSLQKQLSDTKKQQTKAIKAKDYETCWQLSLHKNEILMQKIPKVTKFFKKEAIQQVLLSIYKIEENHYSSLSPTIIASAHFFDPQRQQVLKDILGMYKTMFMEEPSDFH